MVAYSAPWAASERGNPFTPPAGDANFAAFAGALARRYGRGGDFWQEHPELPALPVTSYEIWNELNFHIFWKPQEGAPARYADLYLAARSACEVPIRGRARWQRLRACLDSVAFCDEVVVVDACSSDATASVARATGRSRFTP